MALPIFPVSSHGPHRGVCQNPERDAKLAKKIVSFGFKNQDLKISFAALRETPFSITSVLVSELSGSD
jgi:hypothetical protein